MSGRAGRPCLSVDVLLSDDFPGDGNPKRVAFPRPETVAERDPAGYPVLTLRALIELKLASGISAAHRLEDLADVIQLIRVNRLGREYGDALDPYVRAKFLELWTSAQANDEA